MTRHRTRKNTPAATQPPATKDDARQDRVEDRAVQLAALVRALPHAMDRDSTGTLNGDRHSTGGSKTPPMPINAKVLSLTMRLDSQLRPIEAQAIAILNLDREWRQLADVITMLPDWHRSLAGRSQPLAKEIHDDLDRWLRAAQLALGMRMPDRNLGALCPEHRDEQPTELLQEGDHAELTASIAAGPPQPDTRPLPHGPVCARAPMCGHRVCTVPAFGYHLTPPSPELLEQREKTTVDVRRIIDAGRVTDWILDPEGVLTWLSRTGEPAITWRAGGDVRCPHCKRRWSTTTERRLLARQLADLNQHTLIGPPCAAAPECEHEVCNAHATAPTVIQHIAGVA